MSARRLSMRKISEILRLKWECGLSNRRIARSCSIGRTTVAEYLSRAAAAGLSWPLPAEMDEAMLERLLFPPPTLVAPSDRLLPDWSQVHTELRRKGVTLQLLWEEYKAKAPQGYQYSRFCEMYRTWRGKLSLWMRQEHKAGEKLFVDYCGQTMPVVDPSTGEVRQSQVFVAVLGASNYTFAEAGWTQSLPDWIASHQRAFAFFGGVPAVVIPDNLKSGVANACRYEPDINPTYQEMVSHYGAAVLPARVRKPRDKAKVEVGVQFVERWILAVLRNRTFFRLDELNQAIDELLERLNTRPFRKLPGSRRSLFETLDRPALKPLPTEPYSYAEWQKARVNNGYHVEVDRHCYSVPYQLIGAQLDARITATTIELFRKGRRVASHCRSYVNGNYTTLAEHMSPAHRAYLNWTPDRILERAATTGPSVALLAKAIMDSRSYPQQSFRSILGILRLVDSYGKERVEAACQRALAINATSFRSVTSILKHGLDKRPLPKQASDPTPIIHTNIRGSDYYSVVTRRRQC